MARWYLGLGSNLGEREENLVRAVEELSADERIRVVARSSLYDSAPIGPDQPRFLNAAIAIETDLTGPELLRLVKDIEIRVGRTPSERWGPRLIDIDILSGERPISFPDLVVPHPRLSERAFALLPLKEISPATVNVSKDVVAQDCHRVTGSGAWSR